MSQNRKTHSNKETKARREDAARLQKENRAIKKQLAREKQYRILLDAIQAVLFTVNTEYIITFISDNVASYLGYKADEMTGLPITGFIHSEDIESTLHQFNQALSGSLQTVEFRMLKNNNNFHWVRASMIPDLDQDKCLGVKALLIDIHHRKKTEADLAAKEERYRNIIESIQEGYFEADLEGRLTFCNQALMRMSGYSYSELVGNSFRDLTPPRTTRAMQAIFGRVFKTGQDAKVFNYEVFHKDGHTLILEFAAALIRDGSGRPAGFRGILRDVSEQVKASEKQQRFQTQLYQAKKMEALGTLAGGLAHGFNNVLMAIQGNLSLMRMTLPEDHVLQKHLERINQSTDKGVNLAKQILSFAKMGKFVVMNTNLNNILKSTSRMFVRSKPNLRIHEFFEQQLWTTQVDRVQIGQLLLSLYMNAAEAMPEGGDLYLQSENVILDEAATRPHDVPPGRYVKLSVTDSGMGLEEDAKQRVFEPFFSIYRPTRYNGLGLATVYGTVKSHNGIINVYSEKGHGTTFTIYLPASLKESVGKAQEIVIKPGSETILLVDDDEIAARAGRDTLERSGYRVMVASCGNEAIEIYIDYSNQIDLVLLDVILPDISGEEVFSRIKKINPNVVIVATSGYNVNRQISAMLDQGCVDFVQKPFQPQPLSSKIRSALDKRVHTRLPDN